MSRSFHSNQYEGAFVSHKLQNWEVPMKHKDATWFNNHYVSGRPKAREGFTQFVEVDTTRSDKNPWGDFVGTWDMPKKIPGNCANVTTARRPDAHDKLQRNLKDSNVVISGQQKNTSRKNKGLPEPVDVPEGAPCSNMLEQTKDQTSPVTSERRSGAEAPLPASTSPGEVKATETAEY